MSNFTIKTEVTAFELGQLQGHMAYPLDPTEGTPTLVTGKFVQEFNLNQRGYVVTNPNGSTDFVPKEQFEKDYKPVKVAPVVEAAPKAAQAKPEAEVVDKQAEAEDTTKT